MLAADCLFPPKVCALASINVTALQGSAGVSLDCNAHHLQICTMLSRKLAQQYNVQQSYIHLEYCHGCHLVSTRP